MSEAGGPWACGRALFAGLLRWVPSERDLYPAKNKFPSGCLQQTKHDRNGQRWATRAGYEAEAADPRILKDENYDENDWILLGPRDDHGKTP